MMKLLLGGAVAAALVGSFPAVAQAAPPPGVAQGTTPIAPAAPVRQVQGRKHRMAMEVQTRAEVASHVRAMFAKLDGNRDGFVTREEASAMAGMVRQTAAKRVEARRGQRFEHLDTNHDGVLSRDEFAMRGQAPVAPQAMRDGRRAMPGMMHKVAMRMHGRMFDRADANRDGRVSLQEMTDAALRRFDSADANHDGRLAPEERMQMHRRLREMQRPSRA